MALTEHGYVVSAFQFLKGMNEVLVEATGTEAFGEKIPTLVDIEILVSVNNNLVKPTLAPGQEGITGVILRPVYTVRLVSRCCRTDKLYRVNCVKRVTFP